MGVAGWGIGMCDLCCGALVGLVYWGTMKTFLLLLLMSLPLIAGDDYELKVPGQDIRKWTQAGSFKTIEAKLVDKSEDGKKVQLENSGGRKFWLKTADLYKADQEFIAAWEKLPDDFEYIAVKDDPRPIAKPERFPGEGWSNRLVTRAS